MESGTPGKYKNLSKKYKIDRDDFEAQFERLTRYILATYNFGSELVTLAYLDLMRNGDIAEAASKAAERGIYRRESGEEEQGAEKVIKKQSELIAEAIRARAAEEQERRADVLPGQTSIFENEQSASENGAHGSK